MKYPLSIRILHWLIAAIVLSLIVLGYFMTPFDEDNPQFSERLYFWHKSFGILVLILMCLRLLIRMRSIVPDPLVNLPCHEVLASKIVHKFLYLLAFTVPVLGYIQSSTYEFSSGVHFSLSTFQSYFLTTSSSLNCPTLFTGFLHIVCSHWLAFMWQGRSSAGSLTVKKTMY